MATFKRVEQAEYFMGKCAHGADLSEELTGVCASEGITLGRIEAIGAVSKGCLGYYDQAGREYHFLELDKHLEIASLVGNISLKDSKPFVHAHVTFTDAAGLAFGGHLAAGTIVFACEFCIQAFDSKHSAQFARNLDETTGLGLWKF